VFDCIATLASQCRFRDCSHEGEPGYAVSAALKASALEPARWAVYETLLAEAHYHEHSVDQRMATETKRK
jgi:ribosome biogenesis GTPase